MKRKTIPNALKRIAVAAAAATLASCPAPITGSMLSNAKDDVAPVISILSPAEGSECANIAQISGTVTDAANSDGDPGQVRSLSYAVGGSSVSGNAAVSESGDFIFQFPTTTLGGNFTLSVTATDWNGNAATSTIDLAKRTGNAVPSFTVVPGNRQATLSWDPVPNTASYRLYYTANGSLPSENEGLRVDNVVSPLTLTGLANENMHVFQLVAVPRADWPESRSDYARAIPLSPQSLAPMVSGEYGQIRIEWPSIPGTTEFEVWKSSERDGSYYKLSGSVTGTVYVDTGVAGDGWYWYKVRPTLAGSPLSHANGAQTDPFVIKPRILASYPLNKPEGIKIVGSYAYIADFTSGLRIFDISNPLAPNLVSTYHTNQAVAVAVSDSYAYVADVQQGLVIIDISNPAAPFYRGSYYDSTYAYGATDVAVNGSFAYLTKSASSNYFLSVIDISDPADPVRRGSCAMSDAYGVAVGGTHVYVADGSAGVRKVDVSNPAAPVIEATCRPSGMPSNSYALKVAIVDNYAYVAFGAWGLQIMVIGDAIDPAMPESGTNGHCQTPYAVGVEVSGSFVYVANGGSGFNIVNAFDKASPGLRGTMGVLGNIRKTAVSGRYAFVTDSTSGLLTVDISDPSAMDQVGSYATTPMRAFAVAVSGQYACCMTVETPCFMLFDVSSPSAPELRGSLPFSNYAYDIAISGLCAYVASSSTGLQVIDFSNPSSPTLKGSLPMIGPNGIAVKGSYAYVADVAAGLRIVNIQDPAAPTFVGSCPTTGAMRVAVSGSYAYVADSESGLLVIDVSDPVSPEIVGTCDTDDAIGIAVSGSYAYVTDMDSGLLVIDVSDPTNPQLKAALPAGTYKIFRDVTISGTYAYLAEDGVGLSVVDISDPVHPVRIASSTASSWSRGVAVSGSYAYIAGDTDGFRVIDLLP